MTRGEREARRARAIAPGWLRCGRSFTGRIYLPDNNSTTTAMPDAATDEAVVSQHLSSPAAPAGPEFSKGLPT
jgi:hypothetical protein